MVETIVLEDVRSARLLVQRHLLQTPLVYSPDLSERVGNSVYLKLELFQLTHSFKARGALNKIANLPDSQKVNGVVAASSGNHGLGVSHASMVFGIDAIVVMPVHTPQVKVRQAKKSGAQVILHGENYDDALAYAHKIATRQKKALLPSFDDPLVIAGQGTIALEVLDVLPEVDVIIAPVGGGGLVAGLGVTLALLNHPAKVIGVQAEGASSMAQSLRAGRRIVLDNPQTIADGIKTRQPGEITFEYLCRYAPEVRVVTDDQILSAMACLIQDLRVVAEPAGASSLAALLQTEELHNQGKNCCVVISGGNISEEMLKRVVCAPSE